MFQSRVKKYNLAGVILVGVRPMHQCHGAATPLPPYLISCFLYVYLNSLSYLLKSILKSIMLKYR
jgi:hypothetical protein